MDDPRPTVHVVLAWWPTTEAHCVTLDEALEYVAIGFEVVPDPFDLEVLTRWEQLQRSARPVPTWRWKPKA